MKYISLKEIAQVRGPMDLKSAIAAFAATCPRAVVDEHGRELYKYPSAIAFLNHLAIDANAVKALRVTEVDIKRGHGFIAMGWTPEWLMDLHTITAAALYGRAMLGVSKRERTKAKTHNYVFLYSNGGTLGETWATKEKEITEAGDALAEMLGVPKESIRFLGKVHDEYSFMVLPSGGDRKGKAMAGTLQAFKDHMAAKALTGESTRESATVRRVLQKLDKIKRALSNTTKDVEDIGAYLKDKLEDYRNGR